MIFVFLLIFLKKNKIKIDSSILVIPLLFNIDPVFINISIVFYNYKICGEKKKFSIITFRNILYNFIRLIKNM